MSEGLQVAISHLPRVSIEEPVLQTQVRLERLPQPEMGKYDARHFCWVVVSFFVVPKLRSSPS